jgi:hypothetical protein
MFFVRRHSRERFRGQSNVKKYIRWKLKCDSRQHIVIKIRQISDFRAKMKKENKFLN